MSFIDLSFFPDFVLKLFYNSVPIDSSTWLRTPYFVPLEGLTRKEAVNLINQITNSPNEANFLLMTTNCWEGNQKVLCSALKIILVMWSLSSEPNTLLMQIRTRKWSHRIFRLCSPELQTKKLFLFLFRRNCVKVHLHWAKAIFSSIFVTAKCSIGFPVNPSENDVTLPFAFAPIWTNPCNTAARQ